MNKPKRKRANIVRRILFLLGLAVFLYPFTMRAINYVQMRQELARVQKQTAEQAARAKRLAERSGDDIDLASSRKSQLGTKLSDHIIGSIAIPSLDVNLPLFDNVTDDMLNHGAGVIPGTSAPLGGKSTHTAISAHSGLPTKTMFDGLKQMKLGAEFVITVAGKHRAYKVDRIQVIEPSDAKKLAVQPGRDLATLVTCTPVPANTHRLLVTGHRIPYTEKTADKIERAAKSGWARNLVILAGIFWALVTLLLDLLWRRRQRKQQPK